ncbi:hypothetical protein GHK52_01565 [Lactococcus garvieae]|nr:hypothetical protein [Lactococcus garvieae]
MDRDKRRFWIIIASIAAAVVLLLGSLYIALDFIEEWQERQQLTTHQQGTPRQIEDRDRERNRPPTQAPPSEEERAPAPAPEQGPEGNQQRRQISLDEAREIAERHLQSRNIDASFRNHSGIEREAGTRVWELEYRGRDGLTHEFYIDVYTGDIVKFETGDWD